MFSLFSKRKGLQQRSERKPAHFFERNDSQRRKFWQQSNNSAALKDKKDFGVVMRPFPNPSELGSVLASGLENVRSGEVVEFYESNFTTSFSSSTKAELIEGKQPIAQGVAVELRKEGAVIGLTNTTPVGQGFVAKRTGNLLMIPVGEHLLGRVVDPLGRPLDKKGEIPQSPMKICMDLSAPKLFNLSAFYEPLLTNYILVDSFIGLRKGQTILSTGPTGTGKTSLAIDTIIAQNRLNQHLSQHNRVHCIYVCIGKSFRFVEPIIQLLNKYGAMQHTTIVFADKNTSSFLQFASAYSGSTMAEYWRENESHSLVVYDSVQEHAASYLDMLGKDARPRLSYIYSQLFEKSGKLSLNKGGGSLTSWPLQDLDDVTDVPQYKYMDNLADRKLEFIPENFQKKLLPAVKLPQYQDKINMDPRGKTKVLAIFARVLARKLAQILDSAEDPFSLAQIAAQLFPNEQELVEESTNLKQKGQNIQRLLQQKRLNPMTLDEQCLLLFAAVDGYFDTLHTNDVERFKEGLLKYFKGAVTDQVLPTDTEEQKQYHKVVIDFQDCLKEFMKS